jgi:glycosyltransferase involved in cell wall biosynthesis
LLEREAAAFAPEMVHSNQFCYGALDVSVAKVVTAHSDVLSWARACRKDPLENTSWLQRYVAHVQAGLSGADAVVAPTRWMMDAVADSFALPACRAVIPNGRSVAAEFERARVLRAVTAGRLWDEAKGISILSDVKSSVPVAIAGDFSHESSERAANLGNARFVGQLSETEMLGLLGESAIYLCLSVYEPFGLAALEAARCGCAVIARDIASLQEVWEDGALFFNTAEELAGLLGRMARDAQFLEGARRRSFERSQYFSRERMVEKYCRLFQKVKAGQARAEHVA